MNLWVAMSSQALTQYRMKHPIRYAVLAHMLGFFALCGLSACDTLYYGEPIAGMTITETHYTDAQALAEVCGYAEACAFVVGNSCHLHLPLAANGDVMHREHEVSHCTGRLDAPSAAHRGGYSNSTGY